MKGINFIEIDGIKIYLNDEYELKVRVLDNNTDEQKIIKENVKNDRLCTKARKGLEI